jgi:hypothetical protein
VGHGNPASIDAPAAEFPARALRLESNTRNLGAASEEKFEMRALSRSGKGVHRKALAWPDNRLATEIAMPTIPFDILMFNP